MFTSVSHVARLIDEFIGMNLNKILEIGMILISERLKCKNKEKRHTVKQQTPDHRTSDRIKLGQGNVRKIGESAEF